MSSGGGNTSAVVDVRPGRLSPPELPSGHVDRPKLVGTIGGHEDVRLVSITAPAGYGKTTLLTEWARSERRPVAWVSLTGTDNDPATLMSDIAAAFGRTQGFDSSFWESMSGPGASMLGRLGPRLADALGSPSRPFVMVLDDLHEVSEADACDLLDLVIRRIPAGSTVAVAARAESPALAAWRVHHDVLELGPDDLAFDARESAHFLEVVGGIPGDLADEVHASMEGWVGGLQLALAVARRQPLDRFDGRDRFVTDYLRHEVLDVLDETDRSFLIRTAVLDELSGPVCDDLLGTAGAAARLQALERASLFLVPLERNRSRYRYHAAFRALLLAELDRQEGEAVRRGLHRRAAQWYDRRGIGDTAIEHALRSGDPAWAAEVVARYVQTILEQGRIATIEHWLAQLGDDAILGYPPLAVLTGWLAALSGDAPTAERWLHETDALSYDGIPTDGTASFVSSRAMLRALSCSDGPEQMRADATSAMAAEPTWGIWRPTAEALVAQARLLSSDENDRQTARALFGDAIDSARASDVADCAAVCLAHRALLAIDSGDWSAARKDVADALVLVEQCFMEDYLTSQLVYAASARLALHDGDQETFQRSLVRAMRNRGIATRAVPFWAVQLRLVLAGVHVAVGDIVAARHLLAEVDDVLRRRPALGHLVTETERVRALVASRPNNGTAPLSPAELRVLPYLQTHLTFDEIAARLYLSRNTVGSHARAIYRKLGVSSRSAAVDAATEVGLLGDLAPISTP